MAAQASEQDLLRAWLHDVQMGHLWERFLLAQTRRTALTGRRSPAPRARRPT